MSEQPVIFSDEERKRIEEAKDWVISGNESRRIKEALKRAEKIDIYKLHGGEKQLKETP